MSMPELIVVRCDGEGCGKYLGRRGRGKTTGKPEYAELFVNHADAIETAEGEGWYLDARRELCPRCRAEAFGGKGAA